MSWNVNDFYRKGYFYISRDPNAGQGDLLYNTCRVIIEKQERDEWTEQAHFRIALCLAQGKRWPDYMSHLITTTTHRQDQMSRDPYILFYTLSLYLGFVEYIEGIPIPWKLFNVGVFSWRRHLVTGSRACYALYRASVFLNGLLPQPSYVKELNRFMAMAVEMKKGMR